MSGHWPGGTMGGGPPVVGLRGPQGAGHADRVAALRSAAIDRAVQIYAATGHPLVGYRKSVWGSDVTLFETLVGLQRWSAEQSADADVWYAATFDVSRSPSQLSEFVR